VDFSLGFLHIPRRNLAALDLLNADGDFAAEFFQAKPPHVFRFAKPAIQFPPLLRGKIFCGGLEFRNRAHG
jgi:hypothetical protein